MEKNQELEWVEAQKIGISQDLVAAAKQQLKFLAAVDKNRHLYDGPALERAIYRYKYCWLPLLAKHAESQFPEFPLVVPLDCEWIWHCHRLNPVRYMVDCKELFGRILDNQNVVSSVQGISKQQSEEIWKMMYPNESYELNWTVHLQNAAENMLPASGSTNYDLVSAVKRQSPFYFQVSTPSMNDDLFLEGAVERYKGFLYLIKKNTERNMKRFCVPTYDIDLIWHSHQLHPISYCKDLMAILGKVLEHDDTDSDRTEGNKLDVGFTATTKQWEDTFGLRYWKAGTMFRGSGPSPLLSNKSPFKTVTKEIVPSIEYDKIIYLPRKMLVEVFLEIVGVRNLPAGHTGSLFVYFSKKQPDVLFNTKRRLSIMSELGKKQVAALRCEPTGELLFELMSYLPSSLHTENSLKILGTTSIALQELLNSISKLSVDKWFDLVSSSEVVGSQPITLRVAVSVTPPVQAPYLVHMVRGHPLSSTSSFPLPERFQQAKSWTCIVDEAGNEVISVRMSGDPKKSEGKSSCTSRKEVIGVTRSGKTCLLVELLGEGWSLMGSQWSFQLQKNASEDDIAFELMGSRKITIFHGRKLAYEIEDCKRKEDERDFMTVVEFSDEDPYGKAIALLNLKSGFLRVDTIVSSFAYFINSNLKLLSKIEMLEFVYEMEQVEEQGFVLPGITLAFILSDILLKEGYGSSNLKREKIREAHEAMPEKDCPCSGECSKRNGTVQKGLLSIEYGGCVHASTMKSHCFSGLTGASACGGSGGCGGGCGGSCGGVTCSGGGCEGEC
ncbi:unnamed protein product [Ilex paraguariensis]|uniref:Glycine-rich domain-containing protein 1 n=1 Tax=Ilex paraguariensis TaxID=185542 RepID=A0ABC8S0K4_9AQUA